MLDVQFMTRLETNLWTAVTRYDTTANTIINSHIGKTHLHLSTNWNTSVIGHDYLMVWFNPLTPLPMSKVFSWVCNSWYHWSVGTCCLHVQGTRGTWRQRQQLSPKCW